jgi:hypothetical protein
MYYYECVFVDWSPTVAWCLEFVWAVFEICNSVNKPKLLMYYLHSYLACEESL